MKTIIKLTSEGFSYHTFELKWNPSHRELHSTKELLHSLSKHDQFYPLDGYGNNSYFCGILLQSGIRIYLTETKHRNVIKLIVNPRRLVDPKASYLGIMPPDSGSFELLEHAFTNCMRQVQLPEFLDNWKLSRMDLCANLLWNKKKGPPELLRLMQKEPTPAGYERNRFDNADAGKWCRRVNNRHYLKFSNDSIGLVVYDKRYQMQKEKLSWPGESLSKGILRVELQCHKPWLRNYAKEEQLESTTELMTALTEDSRELICRYARKLHYGGVHYKTSKLETILKNADGIRKKTRGRMLYLGEALQDAKDLREAMIEAGLSKKQLHTCLQHFQALDIHPIPLDDDYLIDHMPSLPKILESLEEDGSEIYLHGKKK